MTIRTVNQNFSVSGPLLQADIRILAEAGVTTLINGRPDNEEANQVPDTMLRGWATEAGLAYYFVPVTSGQYREAAVEEFAGILRNAQGRVHAFCRSGTRVLHLWALAQLCQGVDEAEVIQAGECVGTDLSRLIETYHSNNSKLFPSH